MEELVHPTPILHLHCKIEPPEESCLDVAIEDSNSTPFSTANAALSEDIMVKKRSSSKNQSPSFTDRLEDVLKNEMSSSETYCCPPSVGISVKLEKMKTENLSQFHNLKCADSSSSIKLEVDQNTSAENLPQSHSLCSTANVKLEFQFDEEEEEDAKHENENMPDSQQPSIPDVIVKHYDTKDEICSGPQQPLTPTLSQEPCHVNESYQNYDERNRLEVNHPSGSRSEVMAGSNTIIDGHKKLFEERVHEIDAHETPDNRVEWQASTKPQSPTATTHLGGNGKRHECPSCGKIFSCSGNLQMHIRTHTGEKPYQCLTCGKAFSKKNDLKSHIGTHTGENLYECVTCGKAFSRKYYLQIHIRTHTGEKPHECLTCGKAFSEKVYLKLHTRTHTGEKPYECLTCGKAFSKRVNLNIHIRTHTGEKPHECLTCGKAFSKKSTLQTHMRTHTGEKPFECLTCGKFFSRINNLQSHIRTHTGEKPHECHTCGKAFSERVHLQRHIRTHTGEKPHQCLTCGKFYSRRPDLQRHIRIHTGEKP